MMDLKYFFKKIKWFFVRFFLSISGRLFLYTVIPSCLVTVVLCTLYTTYLTEYHHEIFMQKGQVDYYKIQPSLQYGLYTKNHAVIQSALERLDRDELKKLTIIDSSGEIVFSTVTCGQSSIFILPQSYSPEISFLKHQAQFMIPIEMNSLPDFVDPDDFVSKNNQEYMGWVVIEYDLHNFWSDYKNIIILAIMFLIQSIILSYLISRHVDNKVTQPMVELLKSLRSLERNDFILKVSHRSFGEMNRLQESATKMARSLRVAHKSLESRIEKATQSLRNSMVKIEDQKKQIEIAHKKSEETSESKSQFLAHMSHEYKTPLNSVIGFVDLMLQDRLTPIHRNYCETIKNSAKHLLSMINDILDFNLIEAGKLAIREKRINLRDCIEEVINSLSPLAKDKKLPINYIYYQDVPEYVISDKHRLHQILINLLSNAIKFTDKGSVLIRVSLCDKGSGLTNNKEHIQITVQDTGPGIPIDIQNNLFRPFCHIQKQGVSSYTGSGLGLVITKKIVGLLQGEISYETSLGYGTKFFVELPFILPEVPKDQNLHLGNRDLKVAIVDNNKLYPAICHQISYLNFHTKHYSDLAFLEKDLQEEMIFVFAIHETDTLYRVIHFCHKHKISIEKIYIYSYDESLVRLAIDKMPDLEHTFTLPIKTADLNLVLSNNLNMLSTQSIEVSLLKKSVLIVDDNPINTKLLSSYLNKYSLDVTCLHDSSQFISCIAKKKFDIIFLDIFMPKLDGFGCIRALKQSSHVLYNSVPIIAVTANSLANDQNKLHQEGFWEVLYKPLCPIFLKKLIKKYLNVSQNFHKGCLEQDSGRVRLVIEECRHEVKLCLDDYYQSKFQDLGDRVHMLLGISSYDSQLREIYNILYQLDQVLKNTVINKKKVIRFLKRLTVLISQHQDLSENLNNETVIN